MGYRDQIQEASNSTGFVPHPLGIYPGVVEDVEEKLAGDTGRTVFEIKIRTSAGLAKASVWKNSTADIDGHLLSTSKNREEAEGKYVKAMGRLVRLYRDLGLPEPEGESDEEFERACYDNMGFFVGKACSINVIAGRPRQDGKPADNTVFVNAPTEPTVAAKVAAATLTAGKSGTTTAATKPKAAQSSSLEDIPFLYRTDLA